MQTDYSVTISLGDDTDRTLHDKQYRLFVLKGAQAPPSVVPTIWQATDEYGPENIVAWSSPWYQAFVAQESTFSGGVTIRVTFWTDIEPGQGLRIDDDGKGTIVPNGVDGALAIFNTARGSFTAGFGQNLQIAGPPSASPFCAITLFANMSLVVSPAERILLLFAQSDATAGTVLTSTFASGLLVDLSGATSRTVSYDAVTESWDWSGEPWGQAVPAGSDVAAVLFGSPVR